ncbi:YopX family protein [Eubacterium sp.]|uniref:YopX family protein n=1 Tax=Eubacterium TaxID=1730 RepID=UPI003992A4D3
MKDRYLFKAKTNNGKWIEWNILTGIPHDINIINSTICQCTGLKDKNGKLIWENDIVKDEKGNFYKAIWRNNYCQFSWNCVKSEIFEVDAKWDLYTIRSFEIEVIDNIFDNPELLESEKL